jgi:adenylosuccinate synthase
MERNKVTVVLGSQWGDEGKGKLVDFLAQTSDLCCRCQGGNNAGHTIVANGKTFDFHLLPSGLVNPSCVNVIGNGVVVHIPSLLNEIAELQKKGLSVTSTQLVVSDRAHLVFDVHQLVDGMKETELSPTNSAIGTTRRGIGPAYSTKASRGGIRVHHLMKALHDYENMGIEWRKTDFAEMLFKLIENRRKRYGPFPYDSEKEIDDYKRYAQSVRPFVKDTVPLLHKALKENKRILVEGANALMLDIDFGTYPYVTSSSCGVGGACTGLGIPPSAIGKVYGVVKAYTTRVGGGPFPTEQLNGIGAFLQSVGKEVGVTTGRKRRCGWLDIVVLKYSQMINDYEALNLTKLDVLNDLAEIKIGVRYLIDGKPLESFPADLHVLSRVSVEYESIKGWETDISKCRTWESLPGNCQAYVKRIEELVGVKVELIGVGPSRDAVILR